MFTYIKLKNFMSFKNVIFDFRNGSKGAKRFVSVYGENGSGKSNFVNSIDLLMESIYTRNRNFYRVVELMNNPFREASSHNLPDIVFQIGRDLGQDLGRDFAELGNACRMIECEDETGVEYGFRIGEHEGYYALNFAESLMYEKLYYYTGKQRGTLFEIKNEDGKIVSMFSGKMFASRKIEEEARNEIEKYWGKHTFLSILNAEKEWKNEQYIKDNYNPYTFDIIRMLEEMKVYWQKTLKSDRLFDEHKPENILYNMDMGKIKAANEFILDRSERILKDFFTQAYADIKDVFYVKEYKENEIYYNLYVKKMIGGKLRTLDFKKESAGTQHVLDIIHSLLGVFCGVTVVYDEIDNGIHDLLLKNILESMVDDISGQLIITTHNSYLLESIDIKSVYLITGDYQGNKEVKCLDRYPRIQGTNNPRIMYLKGLFGGVPIVDSFDYGLILNELQESGPNVEGGE